MDEAELKSTRDRLDIAEVMTRYATGIDNVDLEILRGCFADEVEIQASSSGRLHEQFPGSPPYEVGGYYRNTMVRTRAGWKIRRWTLTCTWETGDPRVLLG